MVPLRRLAPWRRLRSPRDATGSAFAAALLVAICCATPSASAAPDAATGEPSYTLTAWTGHEDLTLGDVLAMAEDRDGYLWLGTNTGLVRFDGATFSRPAAASSERPVSALLGTADGSVWIGYGGPGGVARMKGGQATEFTAAAGLIQGPVAALLEDRAGTIWVGGRGGISTFRDGGWHRVTGTPGLADASVYSLHEDPDGRLWLGTSNGVYAGTADGFQLSAIGATFVQDFARDRRGEMWITDTRETIKRLVTGEGPVHGAGSRVPEGGWRIASDRRGSLWVAALGGGLMRVVDVSGVAALERFPYEHEIAGSPRALLVDRNGNLWVGLRAGGLLRIAENSIHNDVRLEGLTNDGVRAVRATPDGAVWVATGHSLHRFHGTRRDVYDLAQTRALDVDAAGQLWIAAVHGFGRFADGRFAGLALPSKVRWQEIMGVASDRHGGQWFCSSQQGVMLFRAGKLQRFEAHPRMANSCSAITMDSRGRAWLGFSTGGVAVYDKGELRQFGEADGLSAGAVVQILEDRTAGIWIATPSGLNRYQDGRLTAVTRRNGPFTDLTAALVQDDDGYLWVGGSSGATLIRFHPAEMERVAADASHEVQYALFDASDGLHGEIARQQGRALAARATDGHLWFVSGTTVVVIDPRRLPQGQRPVAPRIDAVSADGIPAMPLQPRLPAGLRNLAIQWTASSLTAASKLRYRYRLEGYDSEWVQAGARRRVSYPQLPAGDYRFLVSATSDGIWTDGEPWDFAVARPFYLSGAFLVTVVMMTAAGIAGAWWLRIRAVQRQYALVFAERALVSREIHDTLLQNLAAIGIELEAALRQMAPRTAGVDALRRLQHQTAHSVKEARQLVVALRCTGISKAPGLVETLRGLSAHLAATRAASVRLAVEGAPRRCGADVELQLMRICQEAVNNGIVHGHASAIRILVSFAQTHVTLRVGDNGRGFDTTDEPIDGHEHLGLLGMRERAERIGAELSIVSTPGAGTVVEVTSPFEDR